MLALGKLLLKIFLNVLNMSGLHNYITQEMILSGREMLGFSKSEETLKYSGLIKMLKYS